MGGAASPSAPDRPGPLPEHFRHPVGSGLVPGVAAASLVLAAGPENGADWLAAAAAPAAVVLFLTIAVTHTLMVRRRATADHKRSLR